MPMHFGANMLLLGTNIMSWKVDNIIVWISCIRRHFAMIEYLKIVYFGKSN